jgi:hypothetical protein
MVVRKLLPDKFLLKKFSIFLRLEATVQYGSRKKFSYSMYIRLLDEVGTVRARKETLIDVDRCNCQNIVSLLTSTTTALLMDD